MAGIPANVTQGTVTGRFVTAEQVPATDADVDAVALTGSVTFTPSVSKLLHTGSNMLIFPKPVTVTLAADGSFTTKLIATDDTDLNPVGWVYGVTATLSDPSVKFETFYISVTSGTQNLAAISSVASTGGVFVTAGAAGPSAYQSWLNQGNVGTEADFLNAIMVMDWGVRPVLSDTPPTVTAIGGYPVLWIAGQSVLAPVPVTPTTPAYDFSAWTVTAPSLVGVEYQIVDGANIVPLVAGVATSVAGYTRPYVLRVQAVAKPGYVLTSAYTWDRMLMDASALTLYASDGFAGTPSARLAPAGGGAGRTLDNAQGGSNTLTWFASSATEPGGQMITASGTAASKNTEAGTDPAHGEVAVNMGTINHGIELNVIAPFTPAHSRNFAVYVGGTNATRTNAVMVQVYISSTTAVIRFDGNPTGELTYRTSVTEAMMLGTWKVTWVNKFAQITAPDGQVFGKDYSGDGLTHGNWMAWGSGDFNVTKQWTTFDWVKVYR